MLSVNDRRRRILEYLSSERYANRSNLAELFGVCERTIERDIARLSLEAPIWTEQGRGGGIRVSDGWYVDKRYMSKEQEKYIRELMPTLDDYGQKVMRDILTAFAKSI